MPPLDRLTLERILSTTERNAIVLSMRAGDRETDRAAAAATLHLSPAVFEDVVCDAKRKIEEAQARAPVQRPEPRRTLRVGEPEPVRDDGDNAAVPAPSTVVPRVMDLLREQGPMTQADVRRALGVSLDAGHQATLRGFGVRFGPDKVDRSPMLRLAEHVASEESSAGTAAGLPPEEGLDSGDEAANDPDAPADDVPSAEEAAARVREQDGQHRNGDDPAHESAQMGGSVGGSEDEELVPPPPFAGQEPERRGLPILDISVEDLADAYPGLLLELAAKHPDQAHLFDRIENLVAEGDRDGATQEQALP